MLSRGERLTAAIRQRGISKMMSLALDLDVDESAISRWRNDGSMSLSHAARISEVLDISLDWLVLGRGEMELHKAPALRVEESDLIRVIRRFQRNLVVNLTRLLDELSYEVQ